MKKYIFVVIIAITLSGILNAEAQDAKSPRQRIKSDLTKICIALDSFKLDTGRYPTQPEGLTILLPNGGGLPVPRTARPDGYLKSIPVDPWGRPYEYIAAGADYRVQTYGADGVPGGTGDDEDIVGCD